MTSGFSMPRIPSSGLTPEVRKWMEDTTVYLNRMMQARSADGTARASVLLVSPDGSVYNVTVDDLGVLTTTKVYG